MAIREEAPFPDAATKWASLPVLFWAIVQFHQWALRADADKVAAWVQAIGAIAAILAAGWIAHRDSRRRVADAESREAALRGSMLTVLQRADWLLAKAFQYGLTREIVLGAERTHSVRVGLDDVLEAMRSAPLDALRGREEAALWFGARAAVVQIGGAVTRLCQPRDGQDLFLHLDSQDVERAQDAVSAAMNSLGAA